MRKKIFALLLFCIGILYSQKNISQNNTDDLKHSADLSKGLDKIKILSDIDYEYIQSANFPSFLKNHAELEKELLRCKENCDYYWVRFYNQSILYYSSIDDYKKIFFYLQKILDYKTKDIRALELKCNAYRNLIAFLMSFEQFDEAQRYAIEAEKFVKHNSIKEIYITRIYIESGNVNYTLYNNALLTKSASSLFYLQKAKEYYQKAYNSVKGIKNPPEDRFENNWYYQNLYLTANSLYTINDKINAEKIYDKINYFNNKKLIPYRTYLFAKQAEFDIKSKDSIISDPKVLIENIDGIITLNNNTSYKNQSTYFILYKARVLKKTRQYILAEKEYNTAYGRLKSIGKDNLTKLEVTQALGDIYEILGRKEKAIYFKNQTIQLSQFITKASSPFSTQKAEIVLLLEKQRQQRQLELEKLETQKNRNYFIITLMSLVIILTVAFVLFLFNRNLKIKQKLLLSIVNHNKEMALNSELENIYQIKMELSNQKTAIENKQKIAKNLHDDLASGLAVTNFMIMDKAANAETENDRNNFLDIKEEVNSLYENVRKYIHNLYNVKEGNNFSVTEYLFELIKKNESLTDLQFVINSDFGLMDEKLSILQKNQLYRVIKECVTNSLKYANANKIEITIKIIERSCIFSVKDNGVGFSMLQNKGLGVANMQERIAHLGGFLTIESDKDSGTSISGQFAL